MTLTASLLLDLVILIVLIYFVVMGFRRGFILTLCSLLAVVLGLVGGWYLAVHGADLVLPLSGEDLNPAAASLAAKALLFLAGFLGTQLVWTLLCRGLHLVAKLPVLHFLNKALGGVLGLVKGILILMVIRWVLDLLAWIPPEVAVESWFLTLSSSLPFLSLLGG